MKINLLLGDITKIPADVIVNSANPMLWKGSGVCGAIHTAAGRELEKECNEIREKRFPKGLPVGEVVASNAYSLPAKYVFHTVGPRDGKDDISLLKNCYVNCIALAEDMKLTSISFPSISTGIYGVRIESAAKIVKAVFDSLPEMHFVKEVNLVFFEQSDLEVYREEFSK